MSFLPTKMICGNSFFLVLAGGASRRGARGYRSAAMRAVRVFKMSLKGRANLVEADFKQEFFFRRH